MLDDVRASIGAKAAETARAARRRPCTTAARRSWRRPPSCAPAGRRRHAAGARQRRLGDRRDGRRRRPAHAAARGRGTTPWHAGPAPAGALDLTADPAILTAIANDVGTEAIFARQVIAYGGAGDALLALSTSGNSANVIAALAEARRRGLVTIAFVGYDGGRIAADGLADHVVVTRSEHIPRIQEAQATAWHVLRELIEEPA